MKIAEVKINEWENFLFLKLPDNITSEDLDNVKNGDKIILKVDGGEELGFVLNIKDISDEEKKEEIDANVILRKITGGDIEKSKNNEEYQKELYNYCRDCIEYLKLSMKLVGAHLSFDGQRVIFAFTAEGRVDFRELVKMVSRRFKKSIRMHQIGIRDEAKIAGKVGTCGRELCCRNFLKELASVNSEAAEIQQISHRGADRISGICGRLMCCLNYEKEGYKYLGQKLPKVGSFVKYKGKSYKVLSHHILKQTIDLEIDKETRLEIFINDLNK